MDKNLTQITTEVYNRCGFNISEFLQEAESQEYNACRYELSGRKILSRDAKITPKKSGQFVTFWKRAENGPIEPFTEKDPIDFFVVNVRSESNFGQFVFPKTVLLNKGIISTENKEGKRAFRVYPAWDNPTSRQAKQTQKWQLDYFYKIGSITDFDKIRGLYNAD